MRMGTRTLIYYKEEGLEIMKYILLTRNYINILSLNACRRHHIQFVTLVLKQTNYQVTHPSTIRARTSVIGRENVYATWYGRCQKHHHGVLKLDFQVVSNTKQNFYGSPLQTDIRSRRHTFQKWKIPRSFDEEVITKTTVAKATSSSQGL